MSSQLVAAMLKEYGALTREALFAYMPASDPRLPLYDLCAEYPRRGGRSMRPSLCLATARAFGRPLRDALGTAVSIEMMHNAMLIHDDIEDESERRRGLPLDLPFLGDEPGTPPALTRRPRRSPARRPRRTAGDSG